MSESTTPKSESNTKLEEEPLPHQSQEIEDSEHKKHSQSSAGQFPSLIWIGIGVLAFLTIAVLVGLQLQKYFNHDSSSKFSIQQDSISNSKPTTTPTTQPLSKEDVLRQAFSYPESTDVPDANEVFCVRLVMYTNDSVTTVYRYYEELIDLNGWYTGPVGMQTGDESAFFHIYQDDFNADLYLTTEASEHGNTKIEVDISCKNEDAITSTFNRPTTVTNVGDTTQPTPPPDHLSTEITADSPQSEYILPFSNSRKITKEDLVGLSPWELKVARNEIYARHGRPFVHQDLTCYFAKQDWYTLDNNYTEDRLSSLETTNAVFILDYEKEINSPLLNEDSGCS